MRVFNSAGYHVGYLNPSDASCHGHIRHGESSYSRLYRLPNGTWILCTWDPDPEKQEGQVLSDEAARAWLSDNHIDQTKGPNPPLNLAARAANLHGRLPQITMLGEKVYRVGDSDPFTVGDREDDVLQAFIGNPTMNKTTLISRSGHEEAPKLLQKIKKNYHTLKAAIVTPGKKNRGGYCANVVKADQ